MPRAAANRNLKTGTGTMPLAGQGEEAIKAAAYDTSRAFLLIRSYRIRGHLEADLDPLGLVRQAPHQELDPRTYGFKDEDLDGSWQAYGPGGCDVCKNTGYKGLVGIYQVMPISEEMERIIMKNGTAIDLADQARRDNIKDLRQSGLIKVKKGLTSLEEVEGVTNE